MCAYSTTPIPLLVTVDPYFLCQERIRVANHCGNIKIITKIAANNREVVPLGIKISKNCIVLPIVVMVNYIAGFNRAKQVLLWNDQIGLVL